MAVVEVGAADGDVPGRGGEAVDREPAVSDLLRVEVVAAGRAAVAGGDEDRLALRGGLLPERAPEGVAALAQLHLALAVADADGPGQIVFHGAHRGQREAVGHRRAARGVQQDRGAGRNRAGKLDVEVGLGGRAVLTGVLAVNHHRWQVGGQPKETLVGLNQAQVHVRCADDGDRLPCAGDAGLVDRIDVILRGKIARRHHEDDPAALRIGPLGRGLVSFGVELGLSQHLQLGLRMEVVHRRKAGDDRCERGRNRGIGCVGQVRLAVDLIAVNLRSEKPR